MIVATYVNPAFNVAVALLCYCEMVSRSEWNLVQALVTLSLRSENTALAVQRLEEMNWAKEVRRASVVSEICEIWRCVSSALKA